MSAWARDAEEARALDELAGKTRQQLTDRLVFLVVELTDDALRALVAQATTAPKRDLATRWRS